MVVLSEEAKAALEKMQAKRDDAVIRLKARQVCDCGKVGFDLGFDSAASTDDVAEKVGSLTLVYMPESAAYLDGVEVTYHDELIGKSFTFYNPNLKNGGGCGREFN